MKELKSNLSERIVFLKLKSGNSEAFSYFYDKYVNRIYRYVYIKLSDSHQAEDLTQDIFLKVWQHMVDKKHIRSFQAFIFRIARNSVIDFYRKNQRLDLSLEDTSAEDDPNLQTESTTEGHIDKSFDLEKLLGLIKKLKDEYQEVIFLRYVEDLSIDEMSQVLQKDKRNVRVILHRAMNKLKQLLPK